MTLSNTGEKHKKALHKKYALMSHDTYSNTFCTWTVLSWDTLEPIFSIQRKSWKSSIWPIIEPTNMWLCLYLIDRMDGGKKMLIHQETSWKNKIHSLLYEKAHLTKTICLGSSRWLYVDALFALISLIETLLFLGFEKKLCNFLWKEVLIADGKETSQEMLKPPYKSYHDWDHHDHHYSHDHYDQHDHHDHHDHLDHHDHGDHEEVGGRTQGSWRLSDLI